MDRRPSTTTPVPTYAFDGFELDIRRRELRRAGKACPMEPQVFDVLVYLVEHRDRVVPKQELFDHVWSDRFVSDTTLNSRIMTARKAIGDNGQDQRLIRTVRGHGFRFVGEVVERVRRTSAPRPDTGDPLLSSPIPGQPTVGRKSEIDHLRHCLTMASQGARQLVFVTGGPGSGKTTLVETFLEETRRDLDLRIAHGHCLEHHGAGEAYMPVLEALNRLCREPGGEDVVDVLASRAPTWLAQMPWLITPETSEVIRQRGQATARERMLREIVEAIDTLAADRPMILLIEDLQWSDYSTLDLLTMLGRRREPARLLLIGTCHRNVPRPEEHPLEGLVQRLLVQGHCTEVPLAPFGEADIGAYLATRVQDTPFPAGLSSAVMRRTEGNPLFVRLLVDAWVADGALPTTSNTVNPEQIVGTIPATLREVIAHQIDRLEREDQNLLMAASVAGREFTAGLIAACLELDEDVVETRCETLARAGLITEAGISDGPDGSISARFAFAHNLHREVLYERIPLARRTRLHRRIGACLESAYGSRASEIAAELAMHYRRGREASKAVGHLLAAADQALGRNANREAIEHLDAALEENHRRPESAERWQSEVEIQARRALAIIPFKGWASAEVEHAYLRGRELCRNVGTHEQTCRMLFGLATLHEYRGQHKRAQEVLEERLQQEQRLEDVDLLVESYELVSCALFHQGAFARSLDHAERALATFDPTQVRELTFHYDEHPVAACHAWAAQAQWFLGFPDRALSHLSTALDAARQTGHLHTLAVTQTQAATHHQLRREPARVLEWADAAIALSSEQGFEYRLATAQIQRGWALAATGQIDDGLRTIHRGLAALERTGAEMDKPYFLALFAEALGWSGDIAQGLAALDEGRALARNRGGFFYEPELHRLRAWLLLKDDRVHEAAESLGKAHEMARHLGSPMLELRVLTSGAGHPRLRPEHPNFVAALRHILGSFTEGWETPDLREAKRILEGIKPT